MHAGRRGGARSLVVACALAAGCGAEGADDLVDTGASPSLSAAIASPSLHDDLFTPPTRPESDADTTIRSALTGGSSSAPKVFYLQYADGSAAPSADYDACKGKAPKFECSFAPTLAECQRQIQAYLDAWYADFNVIFTLTRPTSGSYYTEVISSGGGAWCGSGSKTAGVAPFLCKDLKSGVAYTFQGGRSAKETAIIIAQEQAHLVGLEHTDSQRDIMNPSICTNCNGFLDENTPVVTSKCDRETQNSYKMMKKALGEWPGGPKPSAFGCAEDTQTPYVKFLSPKQADSMGHDFEVRVEVRDDCDIKKVEISVMPEGLTAVAKAPPYEWDLTGINGTQTITVTATDGSGRMGSATMTVTAPESRAVQDPSGEGVGCTVGTGAFGAAGVLPALAVLFLFSAPHRRSRRRTVTGALSNRR
jgi:hypothetical protein